MPHGRCIDRECDSLQRSWDVAAGVIIAREAGAEVVDQDDSTHATESVATIAASPGIREELLRLLAAALQNGDRGSG